MNIFHIIAQWIQHFFHLHAAGHDVPLPPQPGDAAVTIGPVVPPASILPDGVLAIDARGFAKLAAIEDERAKNPRWKNAPPWWAIEGLASESFEARANLTEAKLILFAGSTGAISSGTGALNNAYAMTPGGAGFGYNRGSPYSDARSFIGDNVDEDGNVVYRGPRPSDMPAFVAACNANYDAHVAQNYPHPEDAIPSTVFRG